MRYEKAKWLLKLTLSMIVIIRTLTKDCFNFLQRYNLYRKENLKDVERNNKTKSHLLLKVSSKEVKIFDRKYNSKGSLEKNEVVKDMFYTIIVSGGPDG